MQTLRLLGGRADTAIMSMLADAADGTLIGCTDLDMRRHGLLQRHPSDRDILRREARESNFVGHSRVARNHH